MTYLKSFILAAVCFFSLHAFAQQPAFVTDSLDTYIKREMQRWNIPGLSIAIVKDGKVVKAQGYGVRDTMSKKPVDANTLFMIASNTKLFTGTGIAMLNSEGRLAETDLVTKYLPWFKMYNDTLTKMVTLEDILSHRMGFETFQGDFYNWDNNGTRRQIIENIAKNKPLYPFRTKWGYCNAGFVTAGEVIHAVTDTTWEDYVRAHFLQPLHMDHTTIGYDGIKNNTDAAQPYTKFMGRNVLLPYDNLDNLAPCAGINSCANDLAQWMLALTSNGMYNGKQVIPEDVILDTRTPRSIVGDGHSSLFPTQHFDLYGLGVEINDMFGKEMYWHTGGANGFVSSLCIFPEDGLGVAVLTNEDANYLFIALMYQIIEAYYNQPYRNISATFSTFALRNQVLDKKLIQTWYNTADQNYPSELPLNDYTGVYYNDVYGKMTVKLENGALNMYFEHHPMLTGHLRPLGGADFVCTYDPIAWGVKKIPFITEDGKVVAVSVTINDFIDYMDYTFVKVQ